MRTQIINLYGGPGSGKSTTAAGVFYELKKRGFNAELVTEYAKEWAWAGRPIGKLDQIEIGAEQIAREARLLGRVEFIVTDSPIYLAAFYEQKYNNGQSLTLPLIEAFEADKKAQGIISHNFFLPKNRRYKSEGRYQTAKEALQTHKELLDWTWRIPLKLLRSRSVKTILNEVLK